MFAMTTRSDTGEMNEPLIRSHDAKKRVCGGSVVMCYMALSGCNIIPSIKGRTYQYLLNFTGLTVIA
jgi:hypothetical protein